MTTTSTVLFLSAVLACALISSAAPTDITVIDLTGVKSFPDKIAAQACVGLFNRNPAKRGAAFALHSDVDLQWLADVEGITRPVITPLATFLAACVQPASGIAAGAVRYNYTRQQAFVPLLVTIAGVLDAVPLDASSPLLPGAPVVFDAVREFAANATLVDVTSRVFDVFGARTSALAFINPGFNNSRDPVNPPLEETPRVPLLDFIVKQRVFAFYLNNACALSFLCVALCQPFARLRRCVGGTAHHALFERMMQNSPFWPKPASVFGYNDVLALLVCLWMNALFSTQAYPIAGDLYEAETDCVKNHNLGLPSYFTCLQLSVPLTALLTVPRTLLSSCLVQLSCCLACPTGQVASDSATNLSFYARKAMITTPLKQNPVPALVFNASKTYISFLVGDGE